METPTITTVYPDGRTETREMTAEEIAAQEADRVAFAKMEADLRAEREAAQQVRLAALAKLQALGLSQAEAAAIAGL